MELIYDVFLDTILDALKMLPFLFAAFLLIEVLEHYSTTFINTLLTKFNKAGPLLGALLGCVPQCGFSVMTANLFSGGIVSPGTLLAVFLATSDEAVLILMGYPEHRRTILHLLAIKVLIAAIAGYLTDLCFPKRLLKKKVVNTAGGHDSSHICGGILMSATTHTLKLFVYLLLVSGTLNLLAEAAGISTLSAFLLKDSILQPFLTALLGFIPNCAVSILLIELYLNQAISFAAVISGLCTNAGLGLVVLFKVNKKKKENLLLMGLLYLAAIIAGTILYYIF